MPQSIHIWVNDTLAPPIFKGIQLNNDILGYIFSLNADMEEETTWTADQKPAIVTLRYTSQVCAHWRELVIGSPSLWARVLNLIFLSQFEDEWRKEVMRRTGTTLLHILLPNYESRWVKAVGWFLSEHWTRIRSLDLHFTWHFKKDEQYWRHLFQRPAPSLEVFKFAWPSTESPQYLLAPDFVLFSNQAPSLHTLCATDMTLDLITFPVQNLRKFILKSSFSAFELLSALSHMPVLETLETNTDFPFARDGDNTHGSLPLVTLPRLISIDFCVHSCVDIALSFLEHINPANGCVLNFYGGYFDEPKETSDGDGGALYGQVLSKYSKSFFELTTATNLEIALTRANFLVEIDLPDHPLFSFSLTCGDFFPEEMFSIFLSSFTVMRLETIRKLTMELEFEDEARLNPDIIKFILALVSVEELTIDPLTLNVLQYIQSDTSIVIIPNLTIIRLDSIHKWGADQISRVADFVKARIELGISVDTLTVMGYDKVVVGQLRKLVPGLEVRGPRDLKENSDCTPSTFPFSGF